MKSIVEREVNSFIPLAEPDFGSLEEKYLLDAFRSGWISSIGEYIHKFESSFAKFCEAKFAIAVANGTVALDLALVVAQVGHGDEVIIPALTFVATAAAVRHVGAIPVFVDCEPEIGTMDSRAVARAVTPKTKAIIPVHLYGHPADMDPILDIADRHNLVIIEDAAEAHGARYKGKRVGSIGHMGTFSFYGNKILTTGEGGMIVTNNEVLANRIRFLKDHAMDTNRRYWHPEVGYNYRMTNLQAAIGCAQLERFDEIIEGKQSLLKLYLSVFSDATDYLINPKRVWAEAVPWLVCMILPEKSSEQDRDKLLSILKEKGVDSRPYFNLLCDMPPYKDFKKISSDNKNDLINSRYLSNRGFNLPSAISTKVKISSRLLELSDIIKNV